MAELTKDELIKALKKAQEVAAVEYKGGRPTFRLVRNAVGEPHAVEAARRLQLPPALIQRAEELLDEDQRSLLALQRRAEELEQELMDKVASAEAREAHALKAEKVAKAREQACFVREESLSTAEAQLRSRSDHFRSQLQAEHQARVDMHDRKLQEIVEGLKRRANGSKGVLRIAGDAIEDLRLERDKEAEAALRAEERKKQIPGALRPEDRLDVGNWVTVLAKTCWYGFKGRVVQVNGLRARVKLESGNTLEFDKVTLGKTSAPVDRQMQAAPTKPRKARNYSMSSW